MNSKISDLDTYNTLPPQPYKYAYGDISEYEYITYIDKKKNLHWGQVIGRDYNLHDEHGLHVDTGFIVYRFDSPSGIQALTPEFVVTKRCWDCQSEKLYSKENDKEICPFCHDS